MQPFFAWKGGRLGRLESTYAGDRIWRARLIHSCRNSSPGFRKEIADTIIVCVILRDISRVVGSVFYCQIVLRERDQDLSAGCLVHGCWLINGRVFPLFACYIGYENSFPVFEK